MIRTYNFKSMYSHVYVLCVHHVLTTYVRISSLVFVDSIDRKAGKGKDSKIGKKAVADQPPDTPPLVSPGALHLWWVGRSYHHAALKRLQCSCPHECTYIHTYCT